MTIQRSQLSLQRPPNVVLTLIIVNVALWLVFSLGINSFRSRALFDVYQALTLQPEASTFGLELWRLLSFGFLHDLTGITHILFNGMALYFLGTPLVQRWGSRAFLKFYLIALVGSGLLSALIGLLLPGPFNVPVVGASGAIFGLLAAFSMVFPTAQLLLFFVIPVKARHIVWIAIGIDIVMFATTPSYDVAIHTHMSGALMGWLLVTGNWHPPRAWRRFQRWQSRRKGPRGGGSGGLHVVPGGRDKYLN